MTRRAIDIDDETWRRIKVEAAERGLTIRQLVNEKLSGVKVPDKAGGAQGAH